MFAITKNTQNYTVSNANTDKGFVIGLTSATFVKSSKGNNLAFVMPGQIIRAVEETDDSYKIKYGKSYAFVDKSVCCKDEDLTKFILDNPLIFNETLVVTSAEAKLRDCDTGEVIYTVLRDEELTAILEKSDSYSVILPDGTNYVTGEAQYATVSKKDVKSVFRIHVTDFSKDTYIIQDEMEVQKLNDIVSYACSFVGNPYVWGGTDPNTGADCSGFVQYVYKHFGYNIPRCSSEQADYGKTVSFNELRPGDLIFYTYKDGNIHHVTMYIGGGKVVQARGKDYGICITDWNLGNPAWAKRIM